MHPERVGVTLDDRHYARLRLRLVTGGALIQGDRRQEGSGSHPE
ncbi:hypothetical protein FOQG_03540 [Fusarium oxysporum f. sp. raphani 54005]|uniref:Uncharacterized protein n=3 Tax=Fusarium oxysporum TaxID=5507 RepID=X0CQ02_FUSOX|nr:hypothetical protein FOQG_03540 [Fusarium oxysporum f. sp. raphani 54005]EXL82502.1 hypothetical protein FOPG_04707 [Fusarium oxysporum f. sp. conglutinans race 2 54008]EXM30731.1 hypothetical protein FOTG_04617 [Fusarium oxysporum f. sp. vasinfectum 25433]